MTDRIPIGTAFYAVLTSDGRNLSIYRTTDDTHAGSTAGFTPEHAEALREAALRARGRML